MALDSSIGDRLAYAQHEQYECVTTLDDGTERKVLIKKMWTYQLADGKVGSVRYIGKTGFGKGLWVGLELADAYEGNNNGAVDGVRYFTPERRKRGKPGVFVRPSKVVKRVAAKKGDTLAKRAKK